MRLSATEVAAYCHTAHYFVVKKGALDKQNIDMGSWNFPLYVLTLQNSYSINPLIRVGTSQNVP